jgi:photosystem II stability/assembly factor-like uncharacterized protein
VNHRDRRPSSSFVLAIAGLIAACSSSSGENPASAGPSDAGGSHPDVGAGGPALDAGGGASDAGNVEASRPLPPDPCIEAGTCPVGVWTNVTPTAMDPTVLRPTMNAFGPGSVVRDPARPSDFYVGGSKAGLWKSSDYGFTWKQVSSTLPDVPRGVTIAVAGTTPPTVWASGYNTIYKSTDGGVTFTTTPLTVSLYSLEVDPNDPTHLVSGLHEADGIVESTDGGKTWNMVDGAGFPTGGVSWYPYFLDTGSAATTRTTWFAIAQNGASAILTHDGGAHWSEPPGISGLQHPHGNSQIYQTGSTLFVAGLYGPGQGVYRSTDLGSTWARVDSGMTPEALVWGTPKGVYAMYAWACSGCNLGTSFETAPPPGTKWTSAQVPSELTIGPNSVAVSNDGQHSVFVAVMWDQGIWRYVEP